MTIERFCKPRVGGFTKPTAPVSHGCDSRGHRHFSNNPILEFKQSDAPLSLQTLYVCFLETPELGSVGEIVAITVLTLCGGVHASGGSSSATSSSSTCTSPNSPTCTSLTSLALSPSQIDIAPNKDLCAICRHLYGNQFKDFPTAVFKHTLLNTLYVLCCITTFLQSFIL